MDHKHSQTLWANILTLMEKRYGAENQNRLARDAGVGIATINRIKTGNTSIGLDVIAKVAEVFGLEPWQLMCPDLCGPDSAPASTLSPMALDLARALDRIDDHNRHQRAYAVAYQVVAFGLSPDGEATAPGYAPTPAPAPHQ